MRKPSKSTWLWIALFVSLVFVCLIRFNRNAFLVPNPGPGDSTQYRLYVEFFRGADVADDLRIASTWRPLVPFLASFLPFGAMTALNVVNFLALAVALPFLHRTLEALSLSRPAVWIGCFLFVYSFPTLYYATIGYVDAMLVGLLVVGAYLMLKERWGLLGALVVAGTFAKEGIAVLLPPIAVYVFLHKQRAALLIPLLYLLLYALITAFIHAWAPGSAHTQFWSPGPDQLAMNATRFRAWASVLLSFGLPGLLACWTLVRYQSLPRPFWHRLAPFAAGFAAAVATCVFAFLSAYVDGRTLWASYPFAIPLGMVAVDRWLLHRRNLANALPKWWKRHRSGFLLRDE